MNQGSKICFTSKGLNGPGICGKQRKNYKKRGGKDLMRKTTSWKALTAVLDRVEKDIRVIDESMSLKNSEDREG